MPSRARGGRAHVEPRPASLVGPRSLEPGSCRAGLVGAALLWCGRQVSVEPHAWSRAQAERGLCSGRAGPPAEPHPVGPGSWGWTARGGAGPIGRTGVPAVPGRGCLATGWRLWGGVSGVPFRVYAAAVRVACVAAPPALPADTLAQGELGRSLSMAPRMPPRRCVGVGQSAHYTRLTGPRPRRQPGGVMGVGAMLG